MIKTIIKNRKGQNLSVILDNANTSRGLVFVMHGLGGFKEQTHIQAFADAYIENGFTVVRFDTTNTFGESDGSYENATVTNYYEDLEDVINWAKSQPWYQEPFWLEGHSLGGICTALYAEKNPEMIKALAPISTVVSGELWKSKEDVDVLCKWKEAGFQNKGESLSKPGVMKILNWTFVVDIMKYDLLTNIDKLTMPTLLIVGEFDASTLPQHQQLLFDALPGPKEMHIIKGAEHTFRDKEHLNEIKSIISNWIKKLCQ